MVVDEQISSSIAVDVPDPMTIVAPHLPAGSVSVVALHQTEAIAERSKHAQVCNRPVVAVEHVQVGLAITIEVADEVPIPWTHLPSWQLVVVAARHREARSVGAQHAEIGIDPV